MIYELLEQIEKSVASGFYYVALFTALTIPDIAGAVDSKNGEADGNKYAGWFDTYVAPKYKAWGNQYLTGRECYKYRCVMLHQGRSHDPRVRYTKTIFMVAQQHNIAYCGAFTAENDLTICIDISMFCRNMVNAAYEWLEKIEQTELYKKNSEKFLEMFTLNFGGN
jgi:hypothetical protein